MKILVTGDKGFIGQTLVKRLEKEKFDIAPVQLTHSRTLGGGHHCCTLDLHRG